MPREATRVQLQDRLKRIPPKRAASFLPYLTGARRRLLLAWMERAQAAALKKALRYVLTRHGDRETIRGRFAAIPYASLPFDLLLSSRDFQDFSDALRETPYFERLREPLKRLAAGEENLFPAEAAIDREVLVRLHRAAEDLSPGERGPVMRLLGVRFDMLNISWIYRSLRYYDLTPEERIARLLPFRYRLHASSLRKMARSADLDEVWPVMKSTVYGAAFAEAPPAEEMAMDRDLRRYLLKTAHSVFRRGSPDLSTLMAYLTLLESEVRDLTTLIEDVRYDYDRRHAALFMARPLIPGGEVRWQW